MSISPVFYQYQAAKFPEVAKDYNSVKSARDFGQTCRKGLYSGDGLGLACNPERAGRIE